MTPDSLIAQLKAHLSVLELMFRPRLLFFSFLFPHTKASPHIHNSPVHDLEDDRTSLPIHNTTSPTSVRNDIFMKEKKPTVEFSQGFEGILSMTKFESHSSYESKENRRVNDQFTGTVVPTYLFHLQSLVLHKSYPEKGVICLCAGGNHNLSSLGVLLIRREEPQCRTDG